MTGVTTTRPTGFSKPLAEVTWPELQDKLRSATEEECMAMMLEERAGRKRFLVLNRIFCRYNKMRGQRERREFVS